MSLTSSQQPPERSKNTHTIQDPPQSSCPACRAAVRSSRRGYTGCTSERVTYRRDTPGLHLNRSGSSSSFSNSITRAQTNTSQTKQQQRKKRRPWLQQVRGQYFHVSKIKQNGAPGLNGPDEADCDTLFQGLKLLRLYRWV